MELVPLSDFVEYQNEFITINDGQEYTRVTTKLHRKGVVLRDIVKGFEIKTKKQQICRANQLLVAEIDAKVGGYGIVPKELEGSIVSSHYFLFNINAMELLPEFLAYILKTDDFFNQIRAQGSTNYAAIRPKDILKIRIPYCNIDLQRSWVEKLRAITIENLHLGSNIIGNQEYFQKLRQVILREAVSGKLVSQDPNDRPASELLKKIETEKEKLINEKKICKEKELPPISEKEIPYVLPRGWEWTRLGEICCGITSGSTPSREQFCTKGGIPYLKVYNIVNNKIDFSVNPQCILETVHRTKNRRSILYPKDVVMNIVGPPLGKIAIIPDDCPEWNCNQAIVFFRPFIKELSKWIYTFLCEGSFLNSIELIGTAGQDNISVTKSKKIIIPIPPLSEQKRIVQKVEELMGLWTELKQKMNETRENSEFLMEAVLKETFAS